jgi:hypothetical protein
LCPKNLVFGIIFRKCSNAASTQQYMSGCGDTVRLVQCRNGTSVFVHGVVCLAPVLRRPPPFPEMKLHWHCRFVRCGTVLGETNNKSWAGCVSLKSPK